MKEEDGALQYQSSLNPGSPEAEHMFIYHQVVTRRTSLGAGVCLPRDPSTSMDNDSGELPKPPSTVLQVSRFGLPRHAGCPDLRPAETQCNGPHDMVRHWQIANLPRKRQRIAIGNTLDIG